MVVGSLKDDFVVVLTGGSVVKLGVVGSTSIISMISSSVPGVVGSTLFSTLSRMSSVTF